MVCLPPKSDTKSKPAAPVSPSQKRIVEGPELLDDPFRDDDDDIRATAAPIRRPVARVTKFTGTGPNDLKPDGYSTHIGYAGGTKGSEYAIQDAAQAILPDHGRCGVLVEMEWIVPGEKLVARYSQPVSKFGPNHNVGIGLYSYAEYHISPSETEAWMFEEVDDDPIEPDPHDFGDLDWVGMEGEVAQ